RGRVWPPASKSHSLRALLLAALAGRPCRLERVLEAGDTEVMREVLRRLGWELVPQAAAGRDRTWDLRPPAATVEAAQLDCGASGTTYRLLTAVLAGIPGRWRLSGVRRLRERPIAELVDALRQLGARIA